jgi:ABC-type nitrate/sulfonate/bicarbonate transport system ATPase subunit
MPDPALLELRAMTAGYPDSGPVVVDIDLSLGAGELLTIVGRSGSGKSTLLLVLAGLLRPMRGTVSLQGREVARGDRRVGLVLQHYGLFPWYKVMDNVLLGRRIRGGRPKAEERRRAEEVLAGLGLADTGDRYPRELSGGEQQRVALARTLMLEPDLLLLDEPFSALDAITREELQDLLLDLLDPAGMAAVMVTHSIDEAVYLGDHVGILQESDAGASLQVHPNPAPPHRGVTPRATPAGAGRPGAPSPAERRTDPDYLAACSELRRRFQEAHRG